MPCWRRNMADFTAVLCSIEFRNRLLVSFDWCSRSPCNHFSHLPFSSKSQKIAGKHLGRVKSVVHGRAPRDNRGLNVLFCFSGGWAAGSGGGRQETGRFRIILLQPFLKWCQNCRRRKSSKVYSVRHFC